MQENGKGSGSFDSIGDGTCRDHFGRRTSLGTAATTGAAALTGCMGGGSDDSTTEDSGPSGRSDNMESTETAAASGGKQDGTLQWGGAVPVQGLDPHINTSATPKRVLENICEEAAVLQDDYSIEPHLAESMEQSDDNILLTSNLRQGVTFHSDKEITSKDVLASYERVQNGDYLATSSFDYAEKLHASGDYTFKVQLTESFAPFPARMATTELSVIPAENAEKDMVEEPIGIGSYVFKSRETKTSFTMSYSEDYWGASDESGLFIDIIVKNETSGPSVRLQSFLAGKYDFTNDIASKDIFRVEQAPNVRLEKQFLKPLVYPGLSCNVAPLDNRDARLTLGYTIDKEKVAEAALYGTGRATAFPATPGSLWANLDIEPCPRDLDEAQKHLDAAGISDSFTTTSKIPQPCPTRVQTAEVTVAGAAEVGINLEIQQITWGTWPSDVYSNRDFQATTSSYLAL